ncbi:dihydroneopterin aldolase [Acidisoma cellulosilytica]|uniref:dihydroneopterin aldolase n=1 Tax=Acidisoma cellulosilyticum TaxID=2802395 RepID=A0A963YXU5_9PROT|nr:dihydroneopterin aldolase [Acidisoma cellulosilyticum]MCB8879156.1 dihydroneopterin aldolase [Acidisoma cellulosilyticum]
MTALPGSHLRRIFIRDLVLDARIGVYASEKGRRQPVRINISFEMRDDGLDHPGGVGPDVVGRVVDYDALAKRIRAFVNSAHVELVETMAEEIARLSLQDPRVVSARVSVEKLTVFPDAASAGVEILRERDQVFPPVA